MALNTAPSLYIVSIQDSMAAVLTSHSAVLRPLVIPNSWRMLLVGVSLDLLHASGRDLARSFHFMQG